MPNPNFNSNGEPEEVRGTEADRGKLSRRDFARGAAVAAVALASSGLLAIETAAGSTLSGAQQSAADPATAEQQDIEAKLANIVRKWGDRLSEEQRQHLRRVLGENERMLAAVRAYPLENGDPPSQVLKLTNDEYEPGADAGHDSGRS